VARLDDVVGYDFVQDAHGFREGVVVVAEGEEEGFYCGLGKEELGFLKVWWERDAWAGWDWHDCGCGCGWLRLRLSKSMENWM
jgi:hypothetical protein